MEEHLIVSITVLTVLPESLASNNLSTQLELKQMYIRQSLKQTT